MGKNNDSCEVCKYCVSSMENRQLVYMCKRYPPTTLAISGVDAMGRAGISIMNVRPQVQLNDTCGEFTLAEPKISLVG